MDFPIRLGHRKHQKKFQTSSSTLRPPASGPKKYKGGSEKYIGNYALRHFLYFTFEIEYLRNFEVGRWILQVPTEILTPILTYLRYVILHMSYVIYGIIDINGVLWQWHMTYMSTEFYVNMGVKSFVGTSRIHLTTSNFFKYSILNVKYKKCLRALFPLYF